MKRRVVIAGAGIGGLSAAVAVRQAGLEAVIVERDPRPRQHGGALMLWSNATCALRDLGVLEAVLARAQRIDHAVIQSSRGLQLTALDLGRIGRVLGAPCVVVSRRALSEVLLGALPEGTVHGGARCIGFSGEDGRSGPATGPREPPRAGEVLRRRLLLDGRAPLGPEPEPGRREVSVHLEGGATLSASALVGADGLRSSVRAALAGDDPPREVRQTAWLGVARSTLVPRGETRAILGPGRRFWCTRVGRSRTYWYAVIADALLLDARSARRLPRALFEGWPSCVGALIDATMATTRVRIADRPPASSWGRGLVTLLGDAAHPTTPDLGQGACQALESAAELGRALSGATELEPALRAYERARSGRAEMFTNLSFVAAAATASTNPVRQMLVELALLSTPAALSERRLLALLTRDAAAGPMKAEPPPCGAP